MKHFLFYIFFCLLPRESVSVWTISSGYFWRFGSRISSRGRQFERTLTMMHCAGGCVLMILVTESIKCRPTWIKTIILVRVFWEFMEKKDVFTFLFEIFFRSSSSSVVQLPSHRGSGGLISVSKSLLRLEQWLEPRFIHLEQRCWLFLPNPSLYQP